MPKKFTYDLQLPDGRTQTYEGDTMEELMGHVNKAHTEAVKALKDREAENATERQKREQAEARLQQIQSSVAGAPPTQSAPAFDREVYYQKLAQDPIEAQNYLDTARFGKPLSDRLQALDRLQASQAQQAQINAVQQFHSRVTDFPATPEAATALQARAQELGGISAQNLELAHYQLIREGVYKPVEEKADEQRGTPPPSTEGEGFNHGDQPTGFDPYDEKLSTEELREKIIEQERQKA